MAETQKPKPIEVKTEGGAHLTHGPIAAARFLTDVFAGNKQVTPNNPAETKDGWTLIEHGQFLWMRYQAGPWCKIHMSNVRYINYAPVAPVEPEVKP
jgi:hypothetical protein